MQMHGHPANVGSVPIRRNANPNPNPKP